MVVTAAVEERSQCTWAESAEIISPLSLLASRMDRSVLPTAVVPDMTSTEQDKRVSTNTCIEYLRQSTFWPNDRRFCHSTLQKFHCRLAASIFSNLRNQ